VCLGCSSEFNETTKIFFWTWQTSGKFYYDANQDAELVYRENGRGDRCGSGPGKGGAGLPKQSIQKGGFQVFVIQSQLIHIGGVVQSWESWRGQ
jgi:hypothetical protein